MTDLNLYNQYNNKLAQPQVINPAFMQNAGYSPNMQGISPAMQGLDYDSFKNQAKDNALAQATKNYDVMEHPGVLAKNFLLSLAMSVGFTGATNWLMNAKQIAQNANSFEAFQQSRLYKAGTFLDDKVGNSSVGKLFGKIINGTKNIFGKIPAPAFMKEIKSKMSTGAIAVLDKQGMYSLGKGAEALNEFVEKLSQIPKDELKGVIPKSAQKEVFKLLKDFADGKVRGPVAWDKLNNLVKLDALDAGKLSKLGVSSRLDKILCTKPDMLTSLNKARFFNNLSRQGPIAKAMQKLSSFIGEASGNGVLGGKMALLMGTVGLMTGFNAMSNAEKGDKLKAFMEDYIGFTLGSYLMSFVVGTWFNKFLGVTELGLDKAAVEAVGKKLGIDMSKGRLQDAVIAYNREYKNFANLEKIASSLRDGKISMKDAAAKAKKFGVADALKFTDERSLLSEITKVTAGKNEQYFSAIRKDIKSAFKSKLTIGSIFKKTVHNEGNFLQRLGRYVVQKPLSLIGRVLSIGRYDLVHGSKYSPKSMLKWAKRFGGGFGRALLVMFVLVEPFRKGFMKLSHMIFGKPKNSALDEGKSEKENIEAQKQVLQNSNASSMPFNTVNPAQSQTNTNILNNFINKPKAASPSMASSLLTSNPQASKIISAKPIAPIENIQNATELHRSYIPSAQPSPYALQKDPREAAVEQAILKAERAERAAQEFLSRGI